MQRTSTVICHIHGWAGYRSRPYMDDFGGTERTWEEVGAALPKLRTIMGKLGIQVAQHKAMVWLGQLYDWLKITTSIPKPKIEKNMQLLNECEGRERATFRELESLIGS